MILSSLAALSALALAAPREARPAPAGRPAAVAAREAAVMLSAAPPQAAAAEGKRAVAFGLEVEAAADGVRVGHVIPNSDAAALGLRPGDLLLDVGGVWATDAESVAKALAEFKPETRLWAVVRRGASVVTLEAELPKLRLAPARGPEDLSPMESELAHQHMEAALASQARAVETVPTPHLEIGAGQKTWVQFPAGLSADLKAGDVVEGVVATGLAADSTLDYLAIGPRSQAWAEVQEASLNDGVRVLRLRVFKLRLKGGHTYPVSARVTDVTGEGTLTQVTPGGTIVTAEPIGLGPDARVQVELLSPVTLFEPPGYYRAGVGLWLRQRGSGPDRVLEVSHVIGERSAAKAGIQEGDTLVTVGGTAAAKLDFFDAIDKLYGPPGSDIAVRVQRGKATVEGMMDLRRGVRWPAEKGKAAIQLPPPYKP